ncbi:hypothetical protein RUM44_005070 [Polyplax serrata]|uniref:Uncharacterized protein n=1 Tax=Polyplax serrata TaxID=468196 RepID=A0ABR1AWU2_POLSC
MPDGCRGTVDAVENLFPLEKRKTMGRKEKNKQVKRDTATQKKKEDRSGCREEIQSDRPSGTRAVWFRCAFGATGQKRQEKNRKKQKCVGKNESSAWSKGGTCQ